MSAIFSLLSSLLGRKSDTGIPSESDPPQVPHPLTPPSGPGLTSSPSLILTPVNEMRARVEAILSVFDDPRYAHLDIPYWVRRVTPNGAFRHGFTVRKFIRVMRDTAANLGLVDGERYVLDAVCACADDSDSDMSSAGLGLKHSPEKEQEALAHRLQRLASAWVAFLLWPFYAYEDHGVTITRTQQQYAMTLAERRLHDEVLRREGHRCFLSGGWDRSYWYGHRARLLGCKLSDLDAVHIFRRAFAMPDSDVDGSEQHGKSAIVTLEMVRRYGQLSDKYLRDADLMDRTESAIALSFRYTSQLQRFAFAFVPTDSPDTYQVKSYQPELTRFEASGVPDIVTFQDHSRVDDDGPQRGPPPSLPSPELLRLHAALANVLHESGVIWILFHILHCRKRDVCNLPQAPAFDGASFWSGVVDSDPDLDRLVQSFAAM